MLRTRTVLLFILITLLFCLYLVRRASSQSAGLRRVTFTSEEAININPTISGDGKRLVFESTANLAGATNSEIFRTVRADLSSDPAAFAQIAASRAPAAGLSQDGTRLAFAATENPLGANPDFNSEIFYFDGETLRQVTQTVPGNASERGRDGNFLPTLSDDGRFIAFSSNRNLTGANADANLEIFIFDTETNSFAQLTDTLGINGSTFAKISGDGSRVAYIRDTSAGESNAGQELLVQTRAGGEARLIASGVVNLSMTYGRAISDDGSRIVYESDSAADTRQVYLFDGRNNSTRQITSLASASTLGSNRRDVPLHPTISGDGNRIAFATRRTVGDISNGDRSIEIYLYDIPTAQVSRVTNAPASADGFSGSNPATEVLTSLSDDGATLAFNFPRTLSGTVSDSDNQNNSEIYVASPAPRPLFGGLKILNYATFGNEPSATEAVAPDSQAVAQGAALSFCTVQPEKNYSTNTFPTEVCGTRVTVNGRAAQLLFVSPTQVIFLTPAETETGAATVLVTNSYDYSSRGQVTVLKAAPGVFTLSGDGRGVGVFLEADARSPAPFDVRFGPRRVVIFSTGVRRATELTVSVNGTSVTVENFLASHDLAGLDEIRVLLSTNLPTGNLNLIVRADGRASNTVQIPIIGNPIPTPTPTPSPTPKPSPSPTPSPVPAPLPTPTPVASPTPMSTPTPAPTPLPAPSPSPTTSPAPSPSPAPVPTPSPSPTPTPPPAGALVISQIYGGGGNTGATYQNDFIELFNRSDKTLDVTGWSVQYQTATGTGTWQRTLLAGSIQPGHYLLIRQAAGTSCSGAPCGEALPVSAEVDPATKINLSGTSGKVALVANSTPLTGACPAGSGIMDFVGYGGSTATDGHCYEGEGPTAAPGNTTALLRKAGGCVDSNSNAADFLIATPLPRNSASELNDCSGGLKPEILVSDLTITEGNNSTKSAEFTVTLSVSSTLTVSLDYNTSSDTASAAEDYQETSGRLIFAPGETTKPVTVTIMGDTKDEPNETFFLHLTNAANATILNSRATGTINDDDPQPSLSINDASVTEGNSDTKRMDFTVKLSAASGKTVTVTYATADGTAATPSDYQAGAATLIFNPGDTEKTASINTNGDTEVETDEVFFVNLSGAINASIADGQGKGTIANDDRAADLSITKIISQAPGGPGSLITYTITVTNNGPDAAERVMVTDNLPSNIIFTACTSISGNGACGGSGNNRTVLIQSIAKGVTERITLQAKTADSAVNGATITNTASVSSDTFDPQTGNNSSTATMTVQPSADLSITQTASAPVVPSGRNVTYTLTVTNNGPDEARDVLVTDNLPSGLSFASCAAATGGVCGGTGNNRIVSFSSLPAGASSTLTLTARVDSSVPGGTSISNQVTVSSSTFDPNAANNSAAQAIHVNTIIINEALISSSASSTTRPDFLELYNTTDRTIDISGLVISFRTSGTSNVPGTVTLPGAVGSGTTMIAAQGYFIIANGASVLNGSNMAVMVDFNASASGFNLNNTTGGIRIDLDGRKLDGLTYQGSSTPPNATFIAYGEGSIFTFTSVTTSDLVRSQTSTDTNDNSADFRFLSSSTTITPKAANPP